MDIRSCCCSGGHPSEAIQLGQYNHGRATSSTCSSSNFGGSRKLKWRDIWMKLKKERRKMFESQANQDHVPYDINTYSQNFDQGLTWDVPDNISRSFSVRFADSSLSSRTTSKKRVVSE